MANSVSLACRNYFEGFHDVSTFNENDSCKNILGILKIVSYFTVVVPLFFGLVYGVSSLIGRVTATVNPSSEDQRMSSVSRRTFGQSVEEQLESMFTSSSKTQKIFIIDGSKVAVVFNPNGEALNVGFMTVNDPVVLVSDKAIPDPVAQRITAKIPSSLTHSTLCIGRINGLTPFQALGLE
jgi:hypothetical protein